MKDLKETISKKIEELKIKIGPLLSKVDSQFTALVPDENLRKIIKIATKVLGILFVLIIFLGIILSPFRVNSNKGSGTSLNKPNIVVSSPIPTKEPTDVMKKLYSLQNQTNNLSFPDSSLNIPFIETDLGKL